MELDLLQSKRLYQMIPLILLFLIQLVTSCPLVISQNVLPAIVNAPNATLVNDTFTASWIWSLTQTRTQNPSYQFGSCPIISSPNSSNVIDNCTLAQNAVILWSTLVANCGWSHSVISGISRYNGSIFIIGNESFSDSRGIIHIRNLIYEFSLIVNFPENTTTLSNNTFGNGNVGIDSSLESFTLTQSYDEDMSQGSKIQNGIILLCFIVLFLLP
jgi:hypothetical protein